MFQREWTLQNALSAQTPWLRNISFNNRAIAGSNVSALSFTSVHTDPRANGAQRRALVLVRTPSLAQRRIETKLITPNANASLPPNVTTVVRCWANQSWAGGSF